VLTSLFYRKSEVKSDAIWGQSVRECQSVSSISRHIFLSYFARKINIIFQ